MVGIVICAHGNLAQELLTTLMFITGGVGTASAIAIDHNVEVAEARNIVKNAILDADDGNGVLLAIDLYGGAPSNICMSLQSELKIEIISGVNLPILIKAITLQENSNLHAMAQKLKEYGKENIYLASDFLKNKDAKSGNTN